jgi:hypothetical protein
MSLAILQRAARGTAQLHYKDKVERPVSFSNYASELGVELATAVLGVPIANSDWDRGGPAETVLYCQIV